MYQHHLKRHRVNRLAAWKVEQLEERTLLSSAFSISQVPVYVPTSSDISDFSDGPLGNAGALLGQLYVDYRHFVNKGGTPSAFASKEENSLETMGSSVAVTIRTRGDMADTTTLLHGLGAELIDRMPQYQALDAWVPISQLSTLAQEQIIANLNAVLKPLTAQEGVAPNQGDEAENAEAMRNTFGLDGTGVKVGVLSDSVNQYLGGPGRFSGNGRSSVQC